MDKRGVLRASTPGGHPLIGLAWIVAALLAAASFVGGPSAWWGVALAGVALAVYLARHRRFLGRLAAAAAALDVGDLEGARAVVAPLLARFPDVALVQKAAAAVLYSGGDPLSAAALYERAAKRIGRDPDIAIGLVASYAALNKAGDARRAAALDPDRFDVRLALAWAELIAVGGDRARGTDLVRGLVSDLGRVRGAERAAMTHALVAVAAARGHDPAGARAALEAVDRDVAPLTKSDRAFIGYLVGVALREGGALARAREAFSGANLEAPGSIGAALARRERALLGDGA